VPLQGLALSPATWEQDVLPRRTGAYSPAWLDQLCASGELVWVGAGSLGRNTGKVVLYFREDARWLGPAPFKGDAPSQPIHDAIRARLSAGAAFWADLLADVRVGAGGPPDDRAAPDDAAVDASAVRSEGADRAAGHAPEPVELQEALWDLVWAGEATNDAFAPLRAPRLSLAAERREANRRFARRRRPGAPHVQGRWSLTENLFRDPPAHGPQARARAELLLERYGIVTRETVLAEGIPGGFASLYGELANLETLGTARRGYFVEGLGGAQFALPAAIERLRGLRTDEPAGALVLAATDPANPFGATLPWPKRDDNRRPSRVPGAHVVTLDAEPVLYVERNGKGVITLRDPLAPDGTPADWLRDALEALANHVRRGTLKRLGLERFDGDPVVGSPFEPLLVEIGFRQGPRRLTLSA
jgi:ATP-dependent Lhr-like helicase